MHHVMGVNKLQVFGINQNAAGDTEQFLSICVFLILQFVKLVSLPSWKQISSALDVTSRFTRHVHSSASGQLVCIASVVFKAPLNEGTYENVLSFSRADKSLQDIVYKLVPGLFKGNTSFFEVVKQFVSLSF